MVTHTSIGWLNTLNPFLIQFTDEFGIRWYGLAYLLGFLLTYLIARAVARKHAWPNGALLAGDFVFAAASGTIIGGRLGYCLLYDPSLFMRFTGEFPFWGLFMIHKGGMASHGGMLGIFVACLWFAKKHGLSRWSLLDIVGLAGCVGIFFGRIANFINGELVGRPAPEGLRWAVRFPQELAAFPSAGIEKLKTLEPVVEQLGVSASQWDHMIYQRGMPGVLQALDRISVRLQEGDPVLAEKVATVLTARHPSQLYEALLEGLLLGLCCLATWTRSTRPGAVALTFLLLYPLARILGEQFRMPDPQIGFEWLGLTRGQWLSAVMFLLAIFFWKARSRFLSRSQ